MKWVLEEIKVWHLEIMQPAIRDRTPTTYQLEKLIDPDPVFCRYLYATVGAPWIWYEKLGWSVEEWKTHVMRPDTHFWVAFQGGSPAGYFEIRDEGSGSAEICLFGLVPNWIGKGLGAHLLADAIRCAARLSEGRVWLHTCSLDHPNALPNYQKQGFTIFREETFTARIPVGPLEPYPGA
ncbi:MAG: GNAT family N-acetyltransferase [Pseudomonadales bacterium]